MDSRIRVCSSNKCNNGNQKCEFQFKFIHCHEDKKFYLHTKNKHNDVEAESEKVDIRRGIHEIYKTEITRIFNESL